VLAASALISVFLPALAAQEPPRLATPDQQDQANDQDQDKSVSTLKVNVNVVQLFFNVKDKKGAPIPNLSKDDFQVFEDGKPQTIKYFNALWRWRRKLVAHFSATFWVKKTWRL
jgi:hypothetical protein